VLVRHFVLKITQAMAMAPRLGRVVMLEGLLQLMPVFDSAGRALRAVGHDDVRVTVGLVTGPTVRVLDDLDQSVDVRILAEVMAMDVLVIVPMRHRPMLRGQTPAGEE
jgi:hypothetical protein